MECQEKVISIEPRRWRHCHAHILPSGSPLIAKEHGSRDNLEYPGRPEPSASKSGRALDGAQNLTRIAVRIDQTRNWLIGNKLKLTIW
jgi:hypothetical protein